MLGVMEEALVRAGEAHADLPPGVSIMAVPDQATDGAGGAPAGPGR